MTFLEYLREYNRKLREDAVIAAGVGGNSSSVDAGEVTSSSSANVGLTDHSVLGYSSKNCKKNGFFGKDDFVIPTNVLSGEILKRIDPLPK